MRLATILLCVFVCITVGWFIGYEMRPDIGLGIYFEDGRLVVDGGRHSGYVFNGNSVEISLPAWIEDKLFVDCDGWRNTDVRNFAFDYSLCNPNIIELPTDPNSVIVVEGSLHTKIFLEKKGK